VVHRMGVPVPHKARHQIGIDDELFPSRSLSHHPNSVRSDGAYRRGNRRDVHKVRRTSKLEKPDIRNRVRHPRILAYQIRPASNIHVEQQQELFKAMKYLGIAIIVLLIVGGIVYWFINRTASSPGN
jgi:hypothetical protein